MYQEVYVVGDYLGLGKAVWFIQIFPGYGPGLFDEEHVKKFVQAVKFRAV